MKKLSALIAGLVFCLVCHSEAYSQSGGTVSPSAAARGIERDVHITIRTDGRTGKGTAEDPFDGSTTAKFDAAFTAAVTSSARIHLGPGTFTTSGQVPGNVRFGLSGGSFVLKGAGVGVTTVKLANGAGTNTNGYMTVIGQHSSDIGTGQTPEYLEIAHMTIDCNRANQPIVTGGNNGVIGAIGVGARNIYLHDLHAKNSYGKGLEAFIVVAAAPAVPDARAVVERVLVTDMVGPTTAINANGTSSTNCIRGIVRDCSVIGDNNTASGQGQIGYGGWLFDGFTFVNNRFQGGVAGFICDSFSNTNLTIINNEVRGPYGWGVIANASAANYTGLYVKDNWFGPSNGGGKAIELASPEPAIVMHGNIILCAVVGTTNLVTPSELGYLKGITNNVQGQINALLTGGAGFDGNFTNGFFYGVQEFHGSDFPWRWIPQDSPNALQLLYNGDGLSFQPGNMRPNDSTPYDIGESSWPFRWGYYSNLSANAVFQLRGRPFEKPILKRDGTNWTHSASTASQIPGDNSIPQITEGAQFGTFTYTPAAAGTRLHISANGWGTMSGNNTLTLALFAGSETNAIAVGAVSEPIADYKLSWAISGCYTTANTAPITFQLRFGPDGGETARIGEDSAGAKYGTSDGIFLKVDESEI